MTSVIVRSLRLLSFCSAVVIAGSLDGLHAPWHTILQNRVHDGRFDYPAAVADTTALDAYLASLGAVDSAALAAAPEAQRTAFWVNAYNALLVRRVLANPGVTSVLDIWGVGSGKVFDSAFARVAGQNMSLNDIQRRRLLRPVRDPRLHAVICPATVSSPPLVPYALTSENLDRTLSERSRKWLADTSRNRVTDDTLILSRVFDWNRTSAEFTPQPARLAEFLRDYGPRGPDYGAIAAGLRARRLRPAFLEYDWRLNGAPVPAPAPAGRQRR